MTNEKCYKLFDIFMKYDKESKKDIIDSYLEKKYTKDRCIMTKDYTIAIGDIPIGLVAHLDTVFEGSKNSQDRKYIQLYYDEARQVMFCPDSPGFDDNAGLVSIVDIVDRGLRPTIILCQNEELGDLGAKKLVKEIQKCPVELKYIIELDRAGYDDCVFYDCANSEFTEYIESCGFRTQFGSFSDISVIGPAWEIACVNLSCGYMNEHTRGEILHVDWMFKTIEKVIVMLKNVDRVPYYRYIPAELDPLGWRPEYGISKEDWKKYLMEEEGEDNHG